MPADTQQELDDKQPLVASADDQEHQQDLEDANDSSHDPSDDLDGHPEDSLGDKPGNDSNDSSKSGDLFRFEVAADGTVSMYEFDNGVWKPDPISDNQTVVVDSAAGTITVTEMHAGYTETKVYTATGTPGEYVESSASYMDLGGKVLSLETNAATGAERLKLEDRSIAFDIDGAAGDAYKLYEAALGRAPDSEGLGFWIAALDAGTRLEDVAAGFLASGEFGKQVQGTDNRAFIEVLYRQALGREADDSGFDFWSNALDRGQITREQMLIQFARSEENSAAIVGAVADGIVYVEWHG